MPPQGFLSSRVAFQTRAVILLGAADVEIQAWPKPKIVKFTHLSPATLRQIKNRDICAALEHASNIAQPVLSHKGRQHYRFAQSPVFQYTLP